MHRMIVAILILASGTACGSTPPVQTNPASASEVAPTPFNFQVVSGSEHPVCNAYADRLRKVPWITEPFCMVPIDPEAEGLRFAKLVPVGTKELEQLYPRIEGLLRYGDQSAYLSKYISGLPGLRANARLYSERQMTAAAKGIDGLYPWASPMFFRHATSLDLDNDGTTDDAVFVREPGYVCGNYGPVPAETPQRAPRHGFILAADGTIDAARSRSILYPSIKSGTKVSDRPSASAGWNSQQSTQDAFRFAGVTYLIGSPSSRDTGQRGGVLEVHKYAKDQRQLVCEISWRLPDTETAPNQVTK